MTHVNPSTSFKLAYIIINKDINVNIKAELARYYETKIIDEILHITMTHILSMSLCPTKHTQCLKHDINS